MAVPCCQCLSESASTVFERMTNLVLVLLETFASSHSPRISGTVAGYPSGTEAARQAFERDKRALRELGIPLTMEPVESEQQVGYRIVADDYYLPDLGLDAAEEQALGFAIAAVQLGGAAGSDALAKLGSPLTEAVLGRAGYGAGSGPGTAPVAVLPSLPALGPIHEALRLHAVLGFRYHGRERDVEPIGLAFRAGAWYLVGRDRAATGGPAPADVSRRPVPELPNRGGAWGLRARRWGRSPRRGASPALRTCRCRRRCPSSRAPRRCSSGPCGCHAGAPFRHRRLGAGRERAGAPCRRGRGGVRLLGGRARRPAVVQGPADLRAAVLRRLSVLASEAASVGQSGIGGGTPEAPPPPPARPSKRGKRAPASTRAPAEVPKEKTPATGPPARLAARSWRASGCAACSPSSFTWPAWARRT